MRILIDTHTLIWYISNALRLSHKAKDLIASEETDVAVSTASIWEISIKVSLGRLEIDGGFHRLPEVLERYDIQILPIIFDHTAKQIAIPFHHKDPFDRMIAAQALVEEIDLVSRDDVFDRYFKDSNIKRIW